MEELIATYGTLVNFVGINAILGLSIYITLACGQLSLGNAAFMGIAAYTSALGTLRADLPLGISLLLGAIVSALVALVLGIPVLRLRGVFLAIATIGFGEVVRIFANNVEFTGGPLGLNGIPNKTQFWHVYGILTVLLFAFWRLSAGRFARALEAIRQDESAARTMGINATYYKVLTFAIGGATAGLAGGLSAHLTFFISPNEFGFTQAVNILVYAIVGGTTTFWGPVLGATLLTLLPELLRNFGVTAGAIRLGINGLILLLIILFLPNGLVTVFQRRRTPQPLSSSEETPVSAAEAR